MSSWFCANKLSLNILKTNYIIFHPSPSQSNLTLSLKFDNTPINKVSSTKFLGIEIDDELNWKTQIDKIKSKISSAIGIIGRIRYKINTATALLLYDTLILPHLYYCNIIWASNYKSNLHKIFILQKRALRVCCYAGKKASSSVLFKSYKKLTVYNIFKFQCANFVFAALHNLVPSHFSSYFKTIESSHNHFTRNRKNLFCSFAKKTARKFSLKISAPVLWNSIPDEIKSSQTLFSFRKLYKAYLIDSAQR